MTFSIFNELVDSHLKVVRQAFTECRQELEHAATLLTDVLGRGNKVLLCGNGGSAADCQHIAAELVGRFERDRRGLPAIALTTDSSALTALGNDFGFESIFSRQIEALAREGDLLWAYSTSGRSANVLRALHAARANKCHTLVFSGLGPSPALDLANCAIAVPSTSTARIQEVHTLFGHLLCAATDLKMN